MVTQNPLRTVTTQVVRAYGRRRLSTVSRHLERSGSDAAAALARALRRAHTPVSSAPELARTDAIEHIRTELELSSEVLDERSTGSAVTGEGPASKIAVSEVVRASKSPFWGQLLFKVVREWKPSNGFELGTCAGISAAYQASAMALNGSGHLTSFEGSPARVELARSVLERLRLDNVEVVSGRFADTLAPHLEPGVRLDYVFIDGHHDGKATVTYFDTIQPFLADAAIVALDDIKWSSDMQQAWTQLRARPDVAASVSLGNVGFLVIDTSYSGSVSADVDLRGIASIPLG